MNADDTNDLHPAKFQEHCQFSCATNGIAELANDEFITTFEGYHQLFPQRTVLFISVILFYDFHATILLHPLSIGFKLLVVCGCHDVTYLCHNQCDNVVRLCNQECRFSTFVLQRYEKLSYYGTFHT